MTKKSLKIAFFHFGFFYEGGGERLLLKQMEGLKKRGHQCVCYTPIYKPRECYSDWIGQSDIKVLVPQYFNWFSGGMLMQMLLSSLIIGFQWWRFFSYDCFVGVGQPGAWMAFCLSKILRKPYMVWMNQPTRFLYPRTIDKKLGLRISDRIGLTARVLKYFKPVIRALDCISIKQADLLMANSKRVVSWLERVYDKKVVQNYPGGALIVRENNHINKLNGSIRINSKIINKPFLLVTNRHFPQKGFEYAISLLPFLNHHQSDLSLVITGRNNRYTKHLKSYTSSLNLEKQVIFTDSVKESALKRLYQESVLYLYTAPQEDYGMGIIEAMSVGTPVIAWNEAGPKETMINNKTGFLIKPYDLKLMANKTRLLLKNQKLRKLMECEAKKRATKFTYKKHVDLLETYLYKIINVC